MNFIWALLLLLGVFTLGACQMGPSHVHKTIEEEEDLTSAINFNITKKVFSNGLTAIVVENHKVPVFSYYTYYKVGGKFETDGITGSSHFLEHMMFKGTEKYPAGEFDNIVEGNGGSNNAYTTNDMTVYYENMPSEHFEKIVDLEADRMQNIVLEEKSYNSEKDVVLEERKMRYENSDRGKKYLRTMVEMFKGTPYGTSVIGKIKDIKGVTRKQMREYFKTFYAPNNAVIVIVGDLDTDKAFSSLEEKFGPIPKTENLAKIKSQRLGEKGFSFKGEYGRWIKMKGDGPTPSFMLAFQGAKLGSTDGFVLDILTSIIGGGASSYLYGKYVTARKPTLRSIYAANHTLQEAGIVMVGGSLLPKKGLWYTRKSLYKNLKKSCTKAITPRTLQKVKNQYMVSMLSDLDTNAGIARFLGDREVYFGDYNFYKKEMNIYNSISLDQVRAACSKYLVEDKSLFISIWNKHKKERK